MIPAPIVLGDGSVISVSRPVAMGEAEKPSLEDDIAYARFRLANADPLLAGRAVLALYQAQTSGERAAGVTAHRNGIGFNSNDARFGTDLAMKVAAGRTLSSKQLACLRKMLPKYARQLVGQGVEF